VVLGIESPKEGCSLRPSQVKEISIKTDMKISTQKLKNLKTQSNMTTPKVHNSSVTKPRY
jgi:hypothetical protein